MEGGCPQPSLFLGSRDRHEITGRVLVNLVTGRFEAVRPTLGPLGNGDAKARCDHLVEFGEKPAKVQMSGYFLSDEGISFPRRKEIRKGVNGGCPMEGGCHQPPGSRSRDRVARLDVVGGTVGGSRERDAGDSEGEGAAVFGPRRGEVGRPPSSRGLR